MYTVKYNTYMVMCVYCIFLASCGKKELPPDLQQAMNVLDQFTAPTNLQNSMFPAAYPECLPSEFVHYIFSDLGAAEMPHSGDISIAEASATRMPLWPKSVSMAALIPDTSKGKQLVLEFDDDRSVLIIEAYEDLSLPPLTTVEFQIKKVEPTESAKLAFQNNVEMGAKY